jgi:hypothetical protein
MIHKYLRSLLTALTSTCLALGSAGNARAADKNVAADSDIATHHIKTVFVILMENHNWTGDGNLDIKGNPAAPYINNTLVPMASHTENYFNPPGIHPSLPNYLWLEAGTNFGILDDKPPSQDHQSTHKHLVTQLEKAGIPWKAYDENITGKVCPLVDGGGIDPDGNQYYGVRHNPFVYFDDVTNHLDRHSAHCIAHVRPFKELAQDLKAKKVASYNFITPNVCDDMHDNCAGDPIAHGDTWLSQNVPTILNSTAYRKGGALFIVWDEADKGDGPIGMIVLSPFAKGNGYFNRVHYTHGSALRTVQEIFSLPLLGDAKKQRDLSNLFKVFP